MLTGDENIVDIDFVVFWRIKDASQYLFNIQNPDTTVKEVAESAMREVVGQSKIQPILTQERQKTEQAVQTLMQRTLDSYGAGIRIDQVQLQKVDPPAEVIDAFRDVQAARADMERLQNEAYGYANKVVPEARGECRAHPAGGRGLQAAGRQRRERSDSALPAGLRPVQEGARRHPQAHVPRDHGARARRHRQDHHRRQGRPGRRALPAARQAAAQSPRRGSKLMRAFLALLIIIVGLAAASIYASAFIVHQNEQALVLRFGEPKRVVREPGLNWKYPLIDTVEVYDKRILDLDSQPQEVTASDQKRLVVDSFARYKIVDPLKFYQTLRYEEGVRSRLGPIVDSTLRRVLGGSTFQEVVRDKREDLMKRIASTVNTEGEDFGLQVVDVRIKRVDLPEQNSKSVFDRMRAERQREAAEFRGQGAGEANRIKATADREATVIRAEASRKAEETRGAGDAERNKIYADAYTRDPGVLRVLPLDAGLRARPAVFRHAAVDHAQFGFLQVFRRPARPRGQTGGPLRPLRPRSNERPRRRLRVGAGDRGPAVGACATFGDPLPRRRLSYAGIHPAYCRVDGGRHWGRPRLAYPRLTVGSR